MLKAIDDFFLGLQGFPVSSDKPLAGTSQKKRKATTASKVKKTIRKKASTAKKTATKRVKTVIDNLVKSTSASVTKTLKPQKTSCKSTSKPTTKRKKNTLGSTSAKYHTPVNGVKKAKRNNTNNKGTAKLVAITAKAKEIRKANPTKKWVTCISEASRALKK